MLTQKQPTRLKPKDFIVQQQQGLALLTALMLISLVAVVGITMIEKSRDDQELTGANIRYDIVYQAAEQTIKQAIQFMQHIEGIPLTSTEASNHRDFAKNFDINNITTENNPVYQVKSAFIWRRGALEDKICGKNKCLAGVPFSNYLQNDEDIWTEYAIISTLDNSHVDENNHLHNTYTYTFIQALNQEEVSTGGQGIDGNLDSSASRNRRYLITVRASGYPPNTVPTGENSRETVMLQAVYTQLY